MNVPPLSAVPRVANDTPKFGRKLDAERASMACSQYANLEKGRRVAAKADCTEVRHVDIRT